MLSETPNPEPPNPPTPGTIPLLAAIYVRTATDDSNEGDLAIQAQLQTCRGHAAAKGYIVIHELIDRGISGATLDRPGTQALRECLERGEIDVVISTKPNRLTRDFRDLLILRQEWQQARVRLEFVDWISLFDGSFEGFLSSVVGAVMLLGIDIPKDTWAPRKRRKKSRRPKGEV